VEMLSTTNGRDSLVTISIHGRPDDVATPAGDGPLVCRRPDAGRTPR
jgi:hypothetical protein